MGWIWEDLLNRYSIIAEQLVFYLENNSINSFCCYSFDPDKHFFSWNSVQYEGVKAVIDNYFIDKRYSAVYFDVVIDCTVIERILSETIVNWQSGNFTYYMMNKPPLFSYQQSRFMELISSRYWKDFSEESSEIILYFKEFEGLQFFLLIYLLYKNWFAIPTFVSWQIGMETGSEYGVHVVFTKEYFLSLKKVKPRAATRKIWTWYLKVTKNEDAKKDWDFHDFSCWNDWTIRYKTKVIKMSWKLLQIFRLILMKGWSCIMRDEIISTIDSKRSLSKNISEINSWLRDEKILSYTIGLNWDPGYRIIFHEVPE